MKRESRTKITELIVAGFHSREAAEVAGLIAR